MISCLMNVYLKSIVQDFLSDECVFEIIQKHAVFANINVWCRCLEVASNKSRLEVFNITIRRLFGYNDYESIKNILFGFKLLPINLLIDRAQLLLCGACLQSEKILLKLCAMHKRDSDVFMNILMLYGTEYSLHRKSVISSVWNLF